VYLDLEVDGGDGCRVSGKVTWTCKIVARHEGERNPRHTGDSSTKQP
jgi:hypothetical protein